MIFLGKTHNGIEVWESICACPDATKPIEIFLRFGDGKWYHIDEEKEKLNLVTYEPTIDEFEFEHCGKNKQES